MFWLEKLFYYSSFSVFLVILFGFLFLNKRRFLAIVLLALSLVFVYTRFIEPKILLTHSFGGDFVARDLGLKIAVVADFHLGIYKNSVALEKIVKRLNQEKPDLVLMPGDFVYHARNEQIPGLFRELSSLKAPAFAVLGNHDVGLLGEIDIRLALISELEKNIRLLQNEVEEVEIKGKKIALIGLSELWEGKTDFNLLSQATSADFTIVLAHNPDTAFAFPESLESGAVDLVVSGHTHGGQIRVPFLYKKMIPTVYPFDKGFYSIKDVDVFVTSGIGTTGWPLRFLVPPEIAIIEI